MAAWCARDCPCRGAIPMPAPTTGQKEQWRCISDRRVCVGLACSPGKGVKLSHCRCLCGLHFSLVFKPHIVPDLLPIAGSELIMQLLLIKQRCYIFISIRLLIPPYLKKKKKGRQCFTGAMEEGVSWDGVGDAFHQHWQNLLPSHFFSRGFQH